MANYYEYSAHEVTNPEQIGVGTGDTTSGRLSDGPEGELRICISLGQKPIAWPDGQQPEGYDWIALTPECARVLAELLDGYRHLWDTPAVHARLETSRQAYYDACREASHEIPSAVVNLVLTLLGVERLEDYPLSWQERLPEMVRKELTHQVDVLQSRQPVADAAEALREDWTRIEADFRGALF